MRSILIADDHEVTRRGLIEIVREEFGDVIIGEVCSIGGLAPTLTQRSWDMVLLDVLMPGGTVLEALAIVRELAPAVPILILTALTEVEYVTQTMRAGASGLIHKSEAGDDLVQAIRTVASGGTYLHPETAAAVASSLRADSEQRAAHEVLSTREMEIFRRIAVGLAPKEVAAELGLSDKTVATYMARIRKKTGLLSPVEIARYALRHHIVD